VLRVSHSAMMLSVDVWPGNDISRDVEFDYRPIVQVNLDSPGGGQAYLLAVTIQSLFHYTTW
jgi:hypothetical protein